MDRTITDWHDDDGVWVAELSCLHSQPLEAQWVATPAGRAAHVETVLDCELCAQTELPTGLTVLRTTDVWDETTAPRALTRRHRVASRRWGLLRVLQGELGFWVATAPDQQLTLGIGEAQPIPPEVDHHIVLVGPVRFCLDFLGRSDA